MASLGNIKGLFVWCLLIFLGWINQFFYTWFHMASIGWKGLISINLNIKLFVTYSGTLKLNIEIFKFPCRHTFQFLIIKKVGKYTFCSVTYSNDFKQTCLSCIKPYIREFNWVIRMKKSSLWRTYLEMEDRYIGVPYWFEGVRHIEQIGTTKKSRCTHMTERWGTAKLPQRTNTFLLSS